jgi:CHAD domain-containing protein
MPKPVSPDKLTSETPVTLAAGLLIALQSKAVWQCRKAVEAGEVEEGVHDMRVAAKRLRETLRIFKPVLPKPGKRCIADVDNLNDALGQVRDRDVLTINVRALASDVPDNDAALQKLLERLAAEREPQFAALLATLAEHMDARDTPAELRALAKRLRAVSGKGAALRVAEFAHGAIYQRLIPVFNDNAAAKRPRNTAEFHALRVRVKHLKYAVEPFLRTLRAEVGPMYQQLAELQELMGIVHDDDVLIATVKGFVAETKPRPDLRLALRHLRDLRKERHALAVGLLTRMEDADFPRHLMDLLD